MTNETYDVFADEDAWEPCIICGAEVLKETLFDGVCEECDEQEDY